MPIRPFIQIVFSHNHMYRIMECQLSIHTYSRDRVKGTRKGQMYSQVDKLLLGLLCYYEFECHLKNK